MSSITFDILSTGFQQYSLVINCLKVFFIKPSSASTWRPLVANIWTYLSNIRPGTASNRASKQVVRTSVVEGVLTPSSGVGLDGGVKPMAKAVSFMKVSACCSVRGVSSTVGKVFSFSPSGCVLHESG